MRGFGTFNVTIGRGLYGQELQKSLRRHANNLKHVLREDKIRVPLKNRLTTGISMVQRGAEDGHNGTKESITLND